MSIKQLLRIDRTLLLAGGIFLLGLCSGVLALNLMPGKRISEVAFENASGVGVRTITLSYVSMGEDGDISIEISPVRSLHYMWHFTLVPRLILRSKRALPMAAWFTDNMIR